MKCYHIIIFFRIIVWLDSSIKFINMLFKLQLISQFIPHSSRSRGNWMKWFETFHYPRLICNISHLIANRECSLMFGCIFIEFERAPYSRVDSSADDSCVMKFSSLMSECLQIIASEPQKCKPTHNHTEINICLCHLNYSFPKYCTKPSKIWKLSSSWISSRFIRIFCYIYKIKINIQLKSYHLNSKCRKMFRSYLRSITNYI